jgi:uncharacterized protein YjbJ (UPF0337 family)
MTFRASAAAGSLHPMAGLIDRITGRLKKAAGDLADDPKLRQQGTREERKADAKDELADAQRQADMKAEEVARLEREGVRQNPPPSQDDPPPSQRP